MFKCSNNHESQTGDFCSVCGAELTPTAVPVVAEGPPEQCPDCGTVKEFRAQAFCEVCGHNFRTGAKGVAPPPPAAAAGVGAVRWEVSVRADATLHGTPNPDAPVAAPPRVFTLFDDETLVGRPAAGVRTPVPIADDAGVSRRQAMLVRRGDGSLTVRDLGSANGTQVNGKDLTPGVDVPLADGDRIGVGAWTLLVVKAVRS